MKNPHQYRRLLLTTAQQSREADRVTIESLGISGDTLMEIAGNRAADIISADISSGRTILFVCGKGNNAGDALVIARLLLNDGHNIILYPVLGTERFSGDAQRNYERLQHLADATGASITIWDRWEDANRVDLIVDGIFGTGLTKDVRSPVAESIEFINKIPKPVYALDIPSGLHCDTGEPMGIAVRAAKTLQFGLQKLGCYLGQGPSYCGERHLLPLPFPDIYTGNITTRLLDESLDTRKVLTSKEQYRGYGTRSDDSTSSKIASRTLHKYNNGVVQVIGGSAGLTGAPLYTARAAWSLGMGAVMLIHPSKWLQTMDVQAPSLIKHPVGQEHSGHFTEDHASHVLDLLERKRGVTVLGPGIGRDEQTLAFVRNIIRNSDGPLIVDADGLRALQGNFGVVTGRQHPHEVILTPHGGELSHLINKPIDSDGDRLRETISLAEALGCTVISKGRPVIVHSAPAHQTLLTGYDTSPFARAGFGDILAGHIAAFYSRTGDATASAEYGLLFGYRRINELVNDGTPHPEPSDLA